MDVELLYFDGCPSWQSALEELRAALAELAIQAEVRLVRVETDEQAQTTRFVGSPTIRVNGADLFPVGHTQYALGCRVYATPGGLRGWPDRAMIAAALREIR